MQMQRDEALAGLNRLLGTLRYEGDDNREEIDAIKWALDRIAELEARIAAKDAALDRIVNQLEDGVDDSRASMLSNIDWAIREAKEGRAK